MDLCSISDAAMAEVDVSPPRPGGGAPSLMVGFKVVGRLRRLHCLVEWRYSPLWIGELREGVVLKGVKVVGWVELCLGLGCFEGT